MDLFEKLGCAILVAFILFFLIQKKPSDPVQTPSADPYIYFKTKVWPTIIQNECGQLKNCCVKLIKEHSCYGVTQKNHPASFEALRGSGKPHKIVLAKIVMYANYYYKPQIYKLPPIWRLPVTDYAVHSSSSQAIKTLQGMIGVKKDGFIGEKTLNALQNKKPDVQLYMKKRLKYLKSLKTYSKYGNGWKKRLKKVEEWINQNS